LVSDLSFQATLDPLYYTWRQKNVFGTIDPVGANADGPVGHHVDTSHRDGGFGRVFTQTHITVTGTMLSPIPPLFSSDQSDPVTSSSEFQMNLGKLPKMNVPRFDGDHPKL
jgi:hypothetical protein